MEIITEKYINIIKNNTDKNNALRVLFYYDIGGYSYLNHTPIKRGYYISVQPVKYTNKNGYSTIETTAFTGYKELLVECSRKSSASERRAGSFFATYENMMISCINKENGYITEV